MRQNLSNQCPDYSDRWTDGCTVSWGWKKISSDWKTGVMKTNLIFVHWTLLVPFGLHPRFFMTLFTILYILSRPFIWFSHAPGQTTAIHFAPAPLFTRCVNCCYISFFIWQDLEGPRSHLHRALWTATLCIAATFLSYLRESWRAKISSSWGIVG